MLKNSENKYFWVVTGVAKTPFLPFFAIFQRFIDLFELSAFTGHFTLTFSRFMMFFCKIEVFRENIFI